MHMYMCIRYMCNERNFQSKTGKSFMMLYLYVDIDAHAYTRPCAWWGLLFYAYNVVPTCTCTCTCTSRFSCTMFIWVHRLPVALNYMYNSIRGKATITALPRFKTSNISNFSVLNVMILYKYLAWISLCRTSLLFMCSWKKCFFF